jgi:gliding motility-associated-like protein
VVNSIPSPPIAGEDTIYCANATPIALSVQGSGSFTWYSDQTLTNVIGTNATLTPSMNVGNTNYYVTETINGCEGPASLIVVEVENCGIIVPTAFTPDGDQTNDTWILDNIDQIYPKNLVSIYNRWGNKVFETDKQNRSWDGRTTSGELCVEGNYFYVIETEEKTHKGFVQLIR